MDLKQFIGPFKRGQRLTVPAEIGSTYIHIGIQIPKMAPIGIAATVVNDDGTITKTGEWRESREKIQLTVNGVNLQIHRRGILEFDLLGEIEWNIVFQQDLPHETIIDIVRE